MPSISGNFFHQLNVFRMSLPASFSNNKNSDTVWMKRLKTSLYRCLPILSWMPLYNSHKFICDLIAGVTVGLTVIPQSLAYATLAGLEPQVWENVVLSCHWVCLYVRECCPNWLMFQINMISEFCGACFVCVLYPFVEYVHGMCAAILLRIFRLPTGYPKT